MRVGEKIESSERKERNPRDRRVESFSDGELDGVVRALTECAEDALSQAACGGIIDPMEVVVWIEDAKRLILYERDIDVVARAVPELARGLRALLVQVDLGDGLDPDRVTREFMHKLAPIRQMLAMDVEAAYTGDPASVSYAEIALSYPSLRALTIYRAAHELHRVGVPLLPRIMTEYAHDRTGIDIHPGAVIGEHFFVDHGTGIVIGETAHVGDRVRIYQGVTLGAASLRDGPSLRGVKRHPTIEDDVTIYSGATILGGDTVIGERSVIGGNVWLTNSVPPGSRVVAEPARQGVREEGPEPESASMQLQWDI
jgi:serine O-acetyltransferase